MLINTKKQRLKVYSRGWSFKNTILKKKERKNKVTKNIIYIYINIYISYIYEK